MSAQRLLANEFKALDKEKWTHIEVSCLNRVPDPFGLARSQTTVANNSQLINENVFEWSVALIVLNPDSLYYGGYFKAKMTFPKNYPYSPPGESPCPLCHSKSV